MILNKLLERQIKRHLKNTDLESNPELVELMFAISQAYQHQEENRQLIERSLDLSSGELTEANKAVQKAYQIIELKNQDLISSLEYAKLVQDSMLSREAYLLEIFPDSFIFNRPKEIVSGDFFWVYKNEKETFLATVDCTGHGVPGAFMSVISFRFLNQAVRDYKLEKPSEILNFLNSEIKNTITDKIENEEAKNALDISLVKIDHKNQSFEFSGVGQKMLFQRGEDLIEIIGDKFHIGQNLDSQKHKITSQEFEIEKNSTLYMYSDGYQDQFGGAALKKFGTKRLKEMIGLISKLDIEQQKATVEETFQDWKNGYDQVDDTFFMGVKLA